MKPAIRCGLRRRRTEHRDQPGRAGNVPGTMFREEWRGMMQNGWKGTEEASGNGLAGTTWGSGWEKDSRGAWFLRGAQGPKPPVEAVPLSGTRSGTWGRG